MTNELRKENNAQVDGVLLTLFVAIAVLLSALIIKTAAVHMDKKKTNKPNTGIEKIEEEPFRREVKNEEYIVPDSEEDKDETDEEHPETLESTDNKPKNGGNIGVDQNTTTNNNNGGGAQAGGNQSGGDHDSGNQNGGDQADGNQNGGDQAGGNQNGGDQNGDQGPVIEPEPEPEPTPNPEPEQNQNPPIE